MLQEWLLIVHYALESQEKSHFEYGESLTEKDCSANLLCQPGNIQDMSGDDLEG